MRVGELAERGERWVGQGEERIVRKVRRVEGRVVEQGSGAGRVRMGEA